MEVTRREFLAISGVVGAGVSLSSLGLDLGKVKAYAAELTKSQKIKIAKQTTTICPYCAVGCGMVCSTDARRRQIINIEGDADNPINEGALCAKGAALVQLSVNNPDRLKKVMYRAPFTDTWQEKSWDWAIGEIAGRVRSVRDAHFLEANDRGERVNRVEAIAHIGSAALDNEELWALQAMMRALGLVYIEHQARI